MIGWTAELSAVESSELVSLRSRLRAAYASSKFRVQGVCGGYSALAPDNEVLECFVDSRVKRGFLVLVDEAFRILPGPAR